MYNNYIMESGGECMPVRGSRGNQSKQTKAYKQMLANTGTLCKSQVYNTLYVKLKNEGRLNRFICTIQYCSQAGKTIEETVKIVCNSFPGYIDTGDFTVDCFKDMLKNYGDIASAWGYGPIGDEISNIMIKNKALSLIEKTESMADIQIYKEIFDKIENIDNGSTGTVINFNLHKKD